MSTGTFHVPPERLAAHLTVFNESGRMPQENILDFPLLTEQLPAPFPYRSLAAPLCFQWLPSALRHPAFYYGLTRPFRNITYASTGD